MPFLQHVNVCRQYCTVPYGTVRQHSSSHNRHSEAMVRSRTVLHCMVCRQRRGGRQDCGLLCTAQLEFLPSGAGRLVGCDDSGGCEFGDGLQLCQDLIPLSATTLRGTPALTWPAQACCSPTCSAPISSRQHGPLQPLPPLPIHYSPNRPNPLKSA